MSDAVSPKLLRYAQIDWDRPLESASPGKAPPAALVAKAKKTGARRKKLVQGEGGFFMNRSLLPPGFHIPPHSHNHSEMLVILKGSLRFDGDSGDELAADDSIVIEANTRYGFTAGDDGLEFLTIRSGEATTDTAG